MTNDEFEKDWRSYSIECDDGVIICLKDKMMICWGTVEDGLFFDTGGEQGSPAYLLKVEGNDLFQKDNDEKWEKLGKLVKTSI
jgi:hypothetical protein